MLATSRCDVVRYLQLRRSLRADEGGIVPSELGDGLRQFLEPAVIGEATVVNARIGAEDEFDFVGRRGFCGGQAGSVEFQCSVDRRKR